MIHREELVSIMQEACNLHSVETRKKIEELLISEAKDGKGGFTTELHCKMTKNDIKTLVEELRSSGYVVQFYRTNMIITWRNQTDYVNNDFLESLNL